MTISISYQELAGWGNKLLIAGQDEESNNEPDNISLTLVSIPGGITLNINKIKFFFFSIKQKIKIQVMAFSGSELVLRVKMSNKLVELVRKLVFKLAYNIAKKKMSDDPEKEFNILDYIHVSASRIYIKPNEILRAQNIPFRLLKLNDLGDKLIIEGIST